MADAATRTREHGGEEEPCPPPFIEPAGCRDEGGRRYRREGEIEGGGAGLIHEDGRGGVEGRGDVAGLTARDTAAQREEGHAAEESKGPVQPGDRHFAGAVEGDGIEALHEMGVGRLDVARFELDVSLTGVVTGQGQVGHAGVPPGNGRGSREEGEGEGGCGGAEGRGFQPVEGGLGARGLGRRGRFVEVEFGEESQGRDGVEGGCRQLQGVAAGGHGDEPGDACAQGEASVSNSARCVVSIRVAGHPRTHAAAMRAPKVSMGAPSTPRCQFSLGNAIVFGSSASSWCRRLGEGRLVCGRGNQAAGTGVLTASLHTSCHCEPAKQSPLLSTSEGTVHGLPALYGPSPA